MARGRYRYVRCSLWTDGYFLRLSPDARLLYVALSTGTASTFAGISRFYTEALVRETGLTAGELEGAFTELEKIPTPARALVVRDRLNGLVWVRDYLKNDPAREKDPNITNEAHRKGIETMLGDLPKDSLVVKKFRAYYHFTRQAPTPTPTGGPHGGQGEGGEVPTTDFRLPTYDFRLPTSDTRARREKPERSQVSLGRSNHDHDPTNGSQAPEREPTREQVALAEKRITERLQLEPNLQLREQLVRLDKTAWLRKFKAGDPEALALVS